MATDRDSSTEVALFRIQQGDLGAFTDLVREHYADLCRFSHGIVHAKDIAEEIVQDVLLYLWEHRNTIALQTTLRAYLYSAVRNKSIDAIRRQKREQLILDTESDSDTIPGHAIAPLSIDDLLTHEALLAAIRTVVATLPETQRTTFLLRWQQGMTYAEIAEATGVSVDAVDQRLTRAMQRIRAVILPQMV